MRGYLDAAPHKKPGWWRDWTWWIDWAGCHLLNPWALGLAIGIELLLSFQIVAESNQTGLSHLKIPIGARATGLGSAYTAMAEDATALYWNPAGLARLRQREISTMHARWLMESSYDFVGYGHPTRLGTLGIGFSRLSLPEQEGRDENRQKTRDFTASDMVFTLGYGTPLSDQVQLGINLKLLESQIEQEKGQGLALDIGASYQPEAWPIALGLAVRNLGPGVTFMNERTRLPLTLALGMASRILEGLTLATDLQYQPYEDRVDFNVGTEYQLLGPLTLRGGYQTFNSEAQREKGSFLSGLAGGFGFRLSRYRLDYAMTPFGELGNTQRISLSARF